MMVASIWVRPNGKILVNYWYVLYLIKLDDNNIGDAGCEYLSKAKWTNLTQLNLSIILIDLESNKISDVGCEFLTKTKWENLTLLDLGIFMVHLGKNNITSSGR